MGLWKDIDDSEVKIDFAEFEEFFGKKKKATKKKAKKKTKSKKKKVEKITWFTNSKVAQQVNIVLKNIKLNSRMIVKAWHNCDFQVLTEEKLIMVMMCFPNMDKVKDKEKNKAILD